MSCQSLPNHAYPSYFILFSLIPFHPTLFYLIPLHSIAFHPMLVPLLPLHSRLFPPCSSYLNSCQRAKSSHKSSGLLVKLAFAISFATFNRG